MRIHWLVEMGWNGMLYKFEGCVVLVRRMEEHLEMPDTALEV